MHTRNTHLHLTLSLWLCPVTGGGIRVSFLMIKFMTSWNLPGQPQTDNILRHVEQQFQCLSRLLKTRHPINDVIRNRHLKMKPFMAACQPVTYFMAACQPVTYFMAACQPVTYFKSSSPLIFHFQEHAM